MVRRGKLERRKGNAGQWLVRLPPDGLMTGPDRAGDAWPDAAPDAGLAEVAAELKEEVTELRVALARAEAGHDAALAQVRAEGDARAAKAEAELVAEKRLSTSLTMLLTEERARAERREAELRTAVDDMRTALAEARRPWLAKVIEGLRRKGS